MTVLTAGLLLVGSWAGCTDGPVVEPLQQLQQHADTTLQARLYQRGVAFDDFLADAEERVDTWTGNYARAEVPSRLAKRAQVLGAWRLLVIAEDWCGDSANTIPYLARLVEDTPALDMRIVDSDLGATLMDAHPTPDGRGATPTVLLLDDRGDIAGCWVERPRELQTWFLEEQDRTGRRELLRQKYAWYDKDAGRTTMSEVVQMIEAASIGERRCGAP